MPPVYTLISLSEEFKYKEGTGEYDGIGAGIIEQCQIPVDDFVVQPLLRCKSSKVTLQNHSLGTMFRSCASVRED